MYTILAEVTEDNTEVTICLPNIPNTCNHHHFYYSFHAPTFRSPFNTSTSLAWSRHRGSAWKWHRESVSCGSWTPCWRWTQSRRPRSWTPVSSWSAGPCVSSSLAARGLGPGWTPGAPCWVTPGKVTCYTISQSQDQTVTPAVNNHSYARQSNLLHNQSITGSVTLAVNSHSYARQSNLLHNQSITGSDSHTSSQQPSMVRSTDVALTWEDFTTKVKETECSSMTKAIVNLLWFSMS